MDLTPEQINRSMDMEDRRIRADEARLRIEERRASSSVEALFHLPRHQQHFRVREAAASFAVQLGGTGKQAVENAKAIEEYIWGDLA